VVELYLKDVYWTLSTSYVTIFIRNCEKKVVFQYRNSGREWEQCLTTLHSQCYIILLCYNTRFVITDHQRQVSGLKKR